MLPQGFIQDLLSRVDIVDIVGRQVELKKAGINHKGLCPFHGEKTPSFIVSPARQTYHCFGCGAHGDAIRFLTERSGMSFVDAVRELAAGVGLDLPDTRTSPAERAREAALQQQRQSLSEVLERAAAHFRSALKASPRAIEYLKGRGLSGTVAARFGLGYAPSGWRTLAGVFARYDDPQLVDAGLVIVGDDEDGQTKRYDRFRDRVMFPIRSMRGQIIGFGGRVVDHGEPKYLNSPETPVFHKGRELYGLFEARRALRAHGYALVVEGYMDVVALSQSGFGNAVATLGTACTAEHVEKLFRFTDSVVFSFDGDEAGRRAAARALEAALPYASDARTIRFLFLPSEHDPDSYVRAHGAQAFEAQIEQARPLSSQLSEMAATDCDLDTAEGRAKMLESARSLIEQLPEGLLREQLTDECARRGAVTPELLRRHWARPVRTRATAFAAKSRPRAGTRAAALPQTAAMLDRLAGLIARHTQLWHDLSAQAHELLAGQPVPYGLFFAHVERLLHDAGPLRMTALFDELGRCDDARLMAPLLERLAGFIDVGTDEDAAGQIAAALRRLHIASLDDQLRMLVECGEMTDDEREKYRKLDAQRSALRSNASA